MFNSFLKTQHNIDMPGNTEIMQPQTCITSKTRKTSLPNEKLLLLMQERHWDENGNTGKMPRQKAKGKNKTRRQMEN